MAGSRPAPFAFRELIGYPLLGRAESLPRSIFNVLSSRCRLHGRRRQRVNQSEQLIESTTIVDRPLAFGCGSCDIKVLDAEELLDRVCRRRMEIDVAVL